MNVAILIPVLDRPQRVEALAVSLRASERTAKLRAVFICSPHDDKEIVAVREHGLEPMIVPWDPMQGDYARKVNYAFRRTDDEYVFLAADDLAFHPGWADAALATCERTGACVAGTNDLGNPRVRAGQHATHFIVSREYGECGTIDEPDSGKLLHEGYWHNFVDDEFRWTAISRETYAHSHEALVEHLHPHWKKAQWDETYTLGQAHFEVDRNYHQGRLRLWMPRARAAVVRARQQGR